MSMLRSIATLLVCGLVVTVPDLASGSEVKKVGIVSAMGETLTVVTHRPEVGSLIDRNAHQTIELEESVFDSSAATAAIATIRRAHANLAIERIDPGPVRGPEVARWIDGTRFAPPADLQVRLASAGLSHLILITRYRSQSNLHLAHSSVGSGTLEGLGFYIDRSLRVKRPDTGEVGIGFLAPYAYFQVRLISLEQGDVEKSVDVTASTSFSAARNKDGVDPWEALNAKQKVSVLHRLIRTEINRVVPELLQQR